MKKILTVIGFLILTQVIYAKPETVTIDLPTMNCAVCPVTVKKALIHVDGVKQVNVNFEKKQAEVSFDNEKTDVNRIMQATAKAGYPSTLSK